MLTHMRFVWTAGEAKGEASRQERQAHPLLSRSQCVKPVQATCAEGGAFRLLLAAHQYFVHILTWLVGHYCRD